MSERGCCAILLHTCCTCLTFYGRVLWLFFGLCVFAIGMDLEFGNSSVWFLWQHLKYTAIFFYVRNILWFLDFTLTYICALLLRNLAASTRVYDLWSKSKYILRIMDICYWYGSRTWKIKYLWYLLPHWKWYNYISSVQSPTSTCSKTSLY